MSEKPTTGSVFATWIEFAKPTYSSVESEFNAAVAAAEERGRRAGIEEARKAIANEANGNRGGDYERRLRMLAELVASLDLAPRDSGKELVPVLYPAQDGTCMYCHESHPGVCGAMNGQKARK